MGTLPSYVPNYNQTELTLNTYKVFYKPYSLWAKNCTLYTTEQIAVVSSDAARVTD